MPRLTAEQREQRKGFIGASDIASIAGLNPFKDAVDILNDKLGYSAEGEDDEAADWGHRLEPLVRSWYVQHGASEADTALTPCGTVRHPSVEWAGCTLDSKIHGTRRGLEIKVVGHRMVFDWDPSDDEGVPHYVRCQAAWQMWCVDLVEIDVAALLGGTQARVWRIPRDRELERHLVQLGEVFWRDSVLERKAPQIAGSDSVRTYLDGKFPPLPAPVVAQADEHARHYLDDLYATKQARDLATESYGAAQAKLIDWLGERGATDVADGDQEFRYRVRKDGRRAPWMRLVKP